jgi:zinc protease
MKIRNAIIAMMLLVCGMAHAQLTSMTIPADTAFRVGKLANGLTYYIRYNNWPEHRANFYIAQKVGSLEEEESQRGLAHFLEHMAFNGSEHFKGNDLIEWCRSKGIEFGGDLNAYTAIDQTVYNINNVPTTSQSTIDSCLLILRDWSCGLLLEQDEIDKERGVIHEEWRLRSSAMSRMLERNLEKLYPGSKYGRRFPIGLMEVIDNFKRKELVDYYHKWYHPDHQGLIIIGDVNVDKVEAEIKRLFDGIKNPADEAQLVDVQVPDNDKPIVIIDKDKEQQYPGVEVMFKHEVFPDSLKQSPAYIVAEYCKRAMTRMLNDRLKEVKQKADCPFVDAAVTDQSYIYSKTKDAFDLSVTPKTMEQTADALKAAFVEVLRARQYGFTATEYARFQQDFMSSLEKDYSNKDKRRNGTFYNQALGNFLNNEALPSIETVYMLMKQLAPIIPLEAINDLMKELVNESDTNMVIVSFNNEKEGNVYPTEEQLLKAISDARATKVEAYVDNVKNEPLITNLPKAGTIKKEVKSQKFDYSIITLSNGVTVLLKKTDLKKDQVIMSGFGGTGEAEYGQADAANLKAFDDVISASGLGNFSNNELQKALAGKIANASLTMGRRMSIDGNSTPKDVETMLQLTYLYFTNIKKDPDSYNNLIQQYNVMLKNREQAPDYALSDSLTASIYDHSWRQTPMKLADVPNVNYDRILQMAKERTANAAGWTFEIIGNFYEATIRPLICQYLGTLPAKGKAPKAVRATVPTTKNVDCTFERKQETPKATAYKIWLNRTMPYTLENSIRADIAGQVLSMVYLKQIREEASAAYTCGASARMTIAEDGFRLTQLLAYCPMKPEKKEVAMDIMEQAVKDLTVKCDKEMLDKVKTLMLKQFDDNAKTNSFWDNIVYTDYALHLDDYTDYKSLVEKQTPETIVAFMKEMMKNANKVNVVMLPQE